MAGLLNTIFDPAFYGGSMGGLLANLPAYMTQPGQAQGFPGQPTDMSGQSRASAMPMQIAPQMPEQPMQAPTQPQMPQAPQQPGFLDRLGAGLGANSNTLLAMGASLLGGQGFGGAAQSAIAGRALDQKQANASQTEAALVKYGLTPDLAKVVASNPNLMASVMSQRLGMGNQTDDIKEYQFAKQEEPGLTFQQFMQRKKAVSGEYSLTPIYGTNERGETVLMQPGKSGEAIQTKLPPGVKVSSGTERVDAGTHWVIYDKRTGAPIGTTPKNIEGKEAAEEVGKARGQAQVALPNVVANAEQTLKIVQDIKNDPYRERGTGGSSIFNAIPATGGFDFAQKVEQLRGKAFLEAFQSLKGGGAITEIEGKKAENAIARLNVAQSEGAFLQALNDLEEVVTAGIGRAKTRAGQGGQTSTPAAASPAGGSGGWKIERVQ